MAIALSTERRSATFPSCLGTATATLLRWPGAAVVLDPKGEQWARTAGTRSQLGPVYRLPEQGIDLADAFDLHDPLDVQELHANLLRTWQDREPIFGEKSLRSCMPLSPPARRSASTRSRC